MSSSRSDLAGVLGEARSLGFLGPGPVDDHVEHALGFVAVAGPEGPDRVVDLGSGGGVPGLVLALEWPEAAVTLLDSSQRRTEFLVRAVSRLSLGENVTVVRERAELLARRSGWRAAADLVVARGFGPPAVVAECGAPLLCVGGRLVVSEPPEVSQESRWPVEGLALLGLGLGERTQWRGRSYQELVEERLCPERFPRRPGIPAKRPLFP
ncbi:MAG: class I SAM-dependent methyltransferase [Actinomycetota bacterium]|nr:class I SAM-dependent methyltransferase [Actinomycetota bacterium]